MTLLFETLAELRARNQQLDTEELEALIEEARAEFYQAEFIVSGDQDLLILEEYEGIRCVSPREFVDLLALKP